jgi:hypothetical protein
MQEIYFEVVHAGVFYSGFFSPLLTDYDSGKLAAERLKTSSEISKMTS